MLLRRLVRITKSSGEMDILFGEPRVKRVTVFQACTMRRSKFFVREPVLNYDSQNPVQRLDSNPVLTVHGFFRIA